MSHNMMSSSSRSNYFPDMSDYVISIMLSDISGKWLLLDAEGIMLSDISGKWLLLDADGMT
jgi:glucan-binding YG repeat protein